jgi:flagella basal body P-ring formation protein FlgA
VGSIVRARHLTPDWIITKNQIVTIEHKVGSLVINAQGVAQESGQIGQKIWVNNFNSGKKVLCWIKNDKKVTTNAKVY